MTISELRDASPLDLQKELVKKQKELRELTFKVSEGQLAQIHAIKSVKRDIARILTILREKQNA